MPTDPPSAETGRKGLRFIADTVEEMHFIFREMQQPDVGIDGQIELKDGKFPTGQFILVQSKAGRSYMENLKPNAFDFYSDPSHLVYWKNCANAVILVIFDPEEKVGYWKHVQGYLRQNPEIIEKRPHKITFDREQDRFTPDCAEGLRALFGPSQSGMEKAFCDHVISKHSKLTLYSVTSDRPLSVALERVFVTLMAHQTSRYDWYWWESIFGEASFEGIHEMKRPSLALQHYLAQKEERRLRFATGAGKIESTQDWDLLRKLEEKRRLMSALFGDLRPEESATPLPLNTALRDHRSLVIVGDPGAGKTTLLKYVALAFARDLAKERLELDEHRIPVLVALRDFNVFLKNSISRKELDALGPSVLPIFLHKYFTDSAPHLKLSEDFFPALLDAGRCAVLLDGLDEVADPADRARMARLVANIMGVAAWSANRFVITSRPRGFEGEPRACLSPHCADCAIVPFEDKDVEQFTLAWYQAVTFDRLGETPEASKEAADRAGSLTHAIQTEPRVRTLAQNPLLLSVLAMVHQRNVELPRQREHLYEECTIFLLGYWDESKERESTTDLARLGGLTREQKRSLLEPVALRVHERGADGTEIERADLEEQFTAHFIEQGKPRAEAKQRATEILNVIVERSGLLVERSPGVFAFAHLTFQEYLAARAIMDRDDYVEFTIKHLHDLWWREVILLEAGLLADTRSGEKTARRRTRPFLEGIRKAGSWKEEILRRDLLFAVRCLGDMETIGVDDDLRQRLTDEAIALWKKTKWSRQRAEVNAAFTNSANTPHGQRFLATLLILIQDPNDNVCWAAGSALGGLGSAAATPAVLDRLLSLSQDPNDAVRSAAVAALGGLGSAAVTPAVLDRLLSLSQDPNDAMRRAAVAALGRLAVPGELAEKKNLVAFWQKRLREKDVLNIVPRFEIFGDFAYGQLQRLAAQQSRLPSAPRSRPSKSAAPAKRKKSAKRP